MTGVESRPNDRPAAPELEAAGAAELEPEAAPLAAADPLRAEPEAEPGADPDEAAPVDRAEPETAPETGVVAIEVDSTLTAEVEPETRT